MQDIITGVPSGLVRWGTLISLCVFLMIIGLSAMIHYPDLINTTLKINSSENYSGRSQFFGEIELPQSALETVHPGQDVVIKLVSYPFQQFGTLKGKIKYIDPGADKEGKFWGKVEFSTNPHFVNPDIHLKPGMLASAEIVVQDATILHRIWQNALHVVKHTR
jgi:multidrug efflux pump subunit AcrA (membrane-fusion protein)